VGCDGGGDLVVFAYDTVAIIGVLGGDTSTMSMAGKSASLGSR
jgi:hypothetical protein